MIFSSSSSSSSECSCECSAEADYKTCEQMELNETNKRKKEKDNEGKDNEEKDNEEKEGKEVENERASCLSQSVGKVKGKDERFSGSSGGVETLMRLARFFVAMEEMEEMG
ncbi:uncharacterized protein MONOS_8107 [Monocercomonoides exilis]|uniref:uncharacterized protein n=1 Tax=Monocercomonoides exilis TaxID=2049356 RepID=UPI003559B88A|nr:hypothetical protein MONOS_8107 [Monocercomonoides exilis]|eukprot:MONOS_8107.1-p1 / transcript=MONOS_8107.1 / gene=MONOS_8107 / organism=Monocercomonoides_exilis_PA203 / gene_product=unspecified product / transcript_product=unspecified product / location=Mono_scaffold00296:37186-37518(-) / protein_length=111 / sequence_SO=supercontig / SO=protein_coding / is_pseudo=false